MTDVFTSLCVDVYLSEAQLTLFRDGNCFLIASMVRAYSLQQMLLSVVADGSTSSLRNARYDRCSASFDIALNRIWAETNPEMM